MRTWSFAPAAQIRLGRANGSWTLIGIALPTFLMAYPEPKSDTSA